MEAVPGSAQSPLRLLHSPSIVAVGLWVRCEIYVLNTDWRHPLLFIDLNIGWDCLSRNGLWSNLTGGNYHRFAEATEWHWQSPCTAPVAGRCLQLGLCNETVKESMADGNVLSTSRHVWAIWECVAYSTCRELCALSLRLLYNYIYWPT